MRRLGLVCLALAILAACARDREEDLRDRLDGWFFLGPTEYFQSQSSCTGAVFRVRVPTLRPEVDISRTVDAAQLTLRTEGFAAIRMDRYSPHEIVDAFLRSNSGDFGREALSTAALAGECFNATGFGEGLREALVQPGATLAYDAETDGVMVLDYRFYRLFFVAGDAVRWGF